MCVGLPGRVDKAPVAHVSRRSPHADDVAQPHRDGVMLPSQRRKAIEQEVRIQRVRGSVLVFMMMMVSG